MPKKYKYVNGNKMIVVNNYDLGTDVIPEEEQIVPDPLVTDVGKVLTVNQAGNPAWADAPEELPSLTGNAGKVLTVSSGASGVEWADAPTELPEVTSADEGDVLTVNASGEWEAAAPGGGLTLYGPYTAKTTESTTIAAGAYQLVDLDAIYDKNNNTVSAKDTTYLISSYQGGSAFSVYAVFPPESQYPAALGVRNDTQAQVMYAAGDIFCVFYTTDELQTIE